MPGLNSCIGSHIGVLRVVCTRLIHYHMAEVSNDQVLQSRLRELCPTKENGLDVTDVGSFGHRFFLLKLTCLFVENGLKIVYVYLDKMSN